VAFVLFEQTLTMLVLMLIGMVLTLRGWMDDVFTKKLGAILLNIIVPCVSLHGFINPPKGATVADLGTAMLLSVIMITVALALGMAVFGTKHRVDSFGTTFSNCGFIGIPLVTAVFGDDAMFYLACLIAAFNIVMYTYGEWLLTGDASLVSPRAIATNPVVIASLLGVVLFLTGFRLPEVAASAIEDLTNANTAIAMLILGSYLAKLDVHDLVSDKRVYVTTFLRLVAAPGITIAVLWLLHASWDIIAMSVFVGMAAPSGANTAIFAQQYDLDYEHAVKVVCISTILSVITLPLMFQLATVVL
jgi:predicted permease